MNRASRTPLGLAVYEGKLNIVKYLIMECGVDVNGGYLWLTCKW